MTSVPFRVVLAFVALAWARSCGFTPGDQKNEGEPCTRSTECRVDLECIAGVCSVPRFDGGSLDASTPADASTRDAAARDADIVDADMTDADTTDADIADADVGADASLGDAAIDASTADAVVLDAAAAMDGGG